jgi:hypothetical protein
MHEALGSVPSTTKTKQNKNPSLPRYNNLPLNPVVQATNISQQQYNMLLAWPLAVFSSLAHASQWFPSLSEQCPRRVYVTWVPCPSHPISYFSFAYSLPPTFISLFLIHVGMSLPQHLCASLFFSWNAVFPDIYPPTVSNLCANITSQEDLS